MTIDQISEAITSTLTQVLADGNSAQKLYLRVRPNGDVDICEETGYCVSEDEYCGRVPHTLSLEVPRSMRDYSGLSEDEIADCAANAQNAAEDMMDHVWSRDIKEWVANGNLVGSGDRI